VAESADRVSRRVNSNKAYSMWSARTTAPVMSLQANDLSNLGQGNSTKGQHLPLNA